MSALYENLKKKYFLNIWMVNYDLFSHIQRKEKLFLRFTERNVRKILKNMFKNAFCSIDFNVNFNI